MKAKRSCLVIVVRSARSTGLSALLLWLPLTVFTSAGLFAQTTGFTYQGSLQEGGTLADGSYDFQFALFDGLAAGAQVGITLTRSNIAVAEGIFTVELDFGNQFPGADRFLEIRVRAAGGGAYTTLSPRQQIASAPYAINAASLGGVAANQYVLTGDARLSDARAPLPNSPNYIQNSVNQQASSNFNLSGTGTATTFNAIAQYNISETRMFFANGLYIDPDFGAPLTNVFIGYRAGNFIVPDPNNTSTSGKFNTFVGTSAGDNTTTGRNNAFFGDRSGFGNNTGMQNTFGGSFAASSNASGSQNTAFGNMAGSGNTTGSGNSAFGHSSRFGSGNLSNATAIGARAQVNCSNCMTLGSISGINGSAADTKVGIGTTAPTNVLTVVGAGASTGGVGSSNEVVARFRQTSGANHLGVSIDALAGTDPILYLAENGSAVWDIRNDAGNDTFQVRHQIGGANITRFSISTTGAASVNGTLAVSTLGSGGATALCRNVSNQIASCSSSIRYKSAVADFAAGLDLIKRLRPVSFRWTEGGAPDLGLIAEEVADIEPLLTTRNPDGQSEGVKYDRLGVVLVNAVKAQQQQIEAKQQEIDQQSQLIARQQAEIDALKARQVVFDEIVTLVCSSNKDAAVCRAAAGR